VRRRSVNRYVDSFLEVMRPDSPERWSRASHAQCALASCRVRKREFAESAYTVVTRQPENKSP